MTDVPHGLSRINLFTNLIQSSLSSTLIRITRIVSARIRAYEERKVLYLLTEYPVKMKVFLTFIKSPCLSI